MKKVGVAILGLGVVGGGTYKILTENKEYYARTQGLDVCVEAVLDINKQRALDLGVAQSAICSNIQEVVGNPNVDIVCECVGGIEPARTFLLTALMNGKTVVTSNKELFCKHWHELEKEARQMNAGLYFEASCVGGVPIIRTLIESMQANNILSLMGIINGTTNYILTKMSEEGLDFAQALKQAQLKGYAEADPTADIDGFDASYKLSILSSLAFHTKVPLENIYREGIRKVTKMDIDFGKGLGYKLKLLGIGKKTEKGIEVRVHPTFIPATHPLAAVNDSFNAVHIVGDSVGDIMLYGRGAGALATGSAIVSDVIFAAKHSENNYSTFKNEKGADPGSKFVSDFSSSYYIRFSVQDKAGVLSKISGVFSKYNVSIKDVMQKAVEGESVPMIFITHQTNEFSVRKALEKIEEMGEAVKTETLIRVENL